MIRSVSSATCLLSRLRSVSTVGRFQKLGIDRLLPVAASAFSTTPGGKDKIQEAASDQSAMEAEPDKPEYLVSFGKDIFLGNFDTELLTFPEVLEKERDETLHEMLEPIERFFNDKVDSKKIDVDAKIPEEVLKGLKELGLFGQQVPQEYGGLGLNATEYARLQEIISLDGSIAVTLAAHQTIGYKGVLLYGNEEQKKKYLPRLASGEMIAAFALTEPSSGSDAGSIRSRAELSQDGKHWILNGNKIWISNGGIADFFTVFARTADDSLDVKASRRISAFLVERKFGGVTSGKPEDKLGIRGSNTTEVHFENVKIPVENVLGAPGDGFKIAMNILNSGRFSMGSAGAGFLKKLLTLTAEHANQRKQFGKPLSEFGLIREKVVNVAMNIYVMEAMAYTTAGLIDSGLYEDCAQEAAMVKIFSSEAGFNGINESLQVLGGLGYMRDFPVERALRDARIMSIFEGTNEILRLLVALNGVKHAGKGLRDQIKKLRNPFLFPGLMWKKMAERLYQSHDKPKRRLKLHKYMHPSLQDYAADCLEYSVLRLQFAVEVLLQRHGAAIIDQQLELKRIADVSIDVYGMTCALSRASRAYCIGLPNAQVEVHLAQLFCLTARNRVKINVDNILYGTEYTGDQLLHAVADEIFKNKGYCVEHPLKRTFW